MSAEVINRWSNPKQLEKLLSPAPPDLPQSVCVWGGGKQDGFIYLYKKEKTSAH